MDLAFYSTLLVESYEFALKMIKTLPVRDDATQTHIFNIFKNFRNSQNA